VVTQEQIEFLAGQVVGTCSSGQDIVDISDRNILVKRNNKSDKAKLFTKHQGWSEWKSGC